MALSEVQTAEVRDLLGEFCDKRVPPDIRGQLRLGFRISGNKVTLFETRPRFKHPTEWGELAVAQFRYNQSRWEWALYWRDQHERWHLYERKRPAKRLETLLKEVDRDPTGIFWG